MFNCKCQLITSGWCPCLQLQNFCITWPTFVVLCVGENQFCFVLCAIDDNINQIIQTFGTPPWLVSCLFVVFPFPFSLKGLSALSTSWSLDLSSSPGPSSSSSQSSLFLRKEACQGLRATLYMNPVRLKKMWHKVGKMDPLIFRPEITYGMLRIVI